MCNCISRITRFRVRGGACHRAGHRPDPLASAWNDGSESALPPEPEIRRMAAFALGFTPVARHRVIGPWQAPVIGPLRGSDEIGRAREMGERPCAIMVDVADEAKFAIWF